LCDKRDVVFDPNARYSEAEVSLKSLLQNDAGAARVLGKLGELKKKTSKCERKEERCNKQMLTPFQLVMPKRHRWGNGKNGSVLRVF
jgi:hypothetical protein